MCAVGRCLEESAFENEFFKSNQSIEDLFDCDMSIDDFLKPQYQGHELDFWKGLQQLHDDANNWTEGEGVGKNLSVWGVENKKKLLKIWKDQE
jgi:hypothetical protein